MTVAVAELAKEILCTAGPAQKCAVAAQLPEAAMIADFVDVPDRPARPERPLLLAPKHMKRRGTRTQGGRVALLHAVAHIELNAIDLAADLLARFGSDPRIADEARSAFLSDWAKVAAEEARHFTLLTKRLGELGASYGDLPVHDGLWRAALATSDDLLARLAIVPLVLEARGLDVTPSMIDSLRDAGDDASASVLAIILEEEVGHVAAGWRWFDHLCRREGHEPGEAFQGLVARFMPGAVRGPFNHGARSRAGLLRHLYIAASA